MDRGGKMKVLNKHKDTIPAQAVYIGRGSPWGNPFVIGKHGNRVEVIARFRAYAEKRLAQEPEWLEPLKQAEGLVCFCYPLMCHGNVIASLMEAVPTLSE